MPWSKATVLFGLVFALFAARAGAEPDGAPSAYFDLAQAPAIFEILADPDKALARKPEALLQLWRPILAANRAVADQGLDACGLQIQSRWQPGSAFRFSLSMIAEPACVKENSSVEIGMTLKSRQEVDALRAILIRRIGPADPKCSNEKSAFWRLRPGYTLRWQETHANMPEIALLDVDPPDVNCSVSSASHDPNVDQAQLEAFFTRLKNEPPPWFDPQAMERWLSAYGPVERSHTAECSTDFYIKSSDLTVPGTSGLLASAIDPECRNRSSGVQQGSLTFGISSRDIFAATKMNDALATVFGERFKPCADEVRRIWKLSDEAIIILITDLKPGPILLIRTIAPNTLECMKE